MILGSLLGSGVIDGRVGERRLVIADAREDYVRWKYERLLTFVTEPPHPEPAPGRRLRFRTIAHPLFDELACLVARRDDRVRALRPLLGPLGLAVWMADLGRLELRAGVFLPQRARRTA